MKFLFFDRIEEVVGDKPNMIASEAINISTATEDAQCSSAVASEARPSTSSVSGCSKKKCRTNYTSEYLKSKTDYYKNKEKCSDERNNLLKRKIELEERKVTALEEYVQLKKTKIHNLDNVA